MDRHLFELKALIFFQSYVEGMIMLIYFTMNNE